MNLISDWTRRKRRSAASDHLLKPDQREGQRERVLSPTERVLARIERAGLHIDEFKHRLKLFADTDPYYISDPEPNPNGTRYEMRLHVRSEPPFELGLIAADVVHNLRACLDNMVWEQHRGRGRPPRNIHFPIEFNEADFAHEASLLLSKLPIDCYRAIEGLQPYKRPGGYPERHAAAILNRLWNRDKHRATPLTYTLARSAIIISYGGGPEPPAWDVRLGPLKDGEVIASCPADPKPNIGLKPNFALEIAIHNSGALQWLSATEVLIDLYKFVRWDAYVFLAFPFP